VGGVKVRRRWTAPEQDASKPRFEDPSEGKTASHDLQRKER